MTPDPLTEEIMSYIRYRTELLQVSLTVQQYNAVYEGVHEWIYESGEKLKKMLDKNP